MSNHPESYVNIEIPCVFSLPLFLHINYYDSSINLSSYLFEQGVNMSRRLIGLDDMQLLPFDGEGRLSLNDFQHSCIPPLVFRIRFSELSLSPHLLKDQDPAAKAEE